MIIKLLYLLYHSFKKFERVLNYRIAISAGMKVGENRLFVGLQHFGTERYLIKFGKNCLITDGVRFITHDGFIQVPLVEKGESVAVVYSKKSTFGKIIDVNNVFIGISTILMPNIETGNVLGKSLLYYAGAQMAGLVLGATHPIVLTSRAETPEGKLHSICLACLAARRGN